MEEDEPGNSEVSDIVNAADVATARGPELGIDGNVFVKRITGVLREVGALSAGSDWVRCSGFKGSGVADAGRWFVSDAVNEAAACAAFSM